MVGFVECLESRGEKPAITGRSRRQQGSRLEEPGYAEALGRNGLVVVEGPNDVIRLDALGVPAVGLLSNVAAAGQVTKIAGFAQRVARGRALLMHDCDPEGEAGARYPVYELARHCDVRLAWTTESHGNRFKGRLPETITNEEAQAPSLLPAGQATERAFSRSGR